MYVRRLVTVAMFALVCTMLGSLASAHHAVSGYDRTHGITMKGTVTEWRWRNPHVFLVWKVADESGKVVEWTGEMASPMTMTSLGLTRTSFKAGDEVTLEVFPAAAGTPQSILRRVLKDGKEIINQNPLLGEAR